MRRSRQSQGVSRAITNFADRNHLPKWLVVSGGVLFTIFCFIMAVSGNYLLFKLSNKVYKNQKCYKYKNNHLPQCMSHEMEEIRSTPLGEGLILYISSMLMPTDKIFWRFLCQFF